MKDLPIYSFFLALSYYVYIYRLARAPNPHDCSTRSFTTPRALQKRGWGLHGGCILYPHPPRIVLMLSLSRPRRNPVYSRLGILSKYNIICWWCMLLLVLPPVTVNLWSLSITHYRLIICWSCKVRLVWS
jgi:hypothetical protein